MSAMILVVEDDADLRECLEESLKTHGFAVRLAVSAEDAIRQLKAGEKVDLIISDLLMRDGDGIALLNFVRASDPLKPPFFLLTGQSRVTPDQARLMGAQEFILKPFNFAELLVLIRRHLAGVSSTCAV